MKLLHMLTLFATLGLALARDFFATLGLEASYPVIGAFGLAVATMMIFRSLLAVLAVAILSIMVSLPREVLESRGFDHEMLLALVLVIVAYPWLRRGFANA